MRIVIVTDARKPQVNGVVQTLSKTRDDCRAFVEDRSWRKSTLQFESYLSPRTRETAVAQPESSASR